MNLCKLCSITSGASLGSIAIQTVVGFRDSRLAINLGSIKIGGKKRRKNQATDEKKSGFISDDCLKLLLRCSAVQVTLKDTFMQTSVALLVLDNLSAYYKKV